MLSTSQHGRLVAVSGFYCSMRCVCMQELKERQREVMGEVLMDMLRALATPNMDVRKKVLDIALDLIHARNIDEVRCFPNLDWVECCSAPRPEFSGDRDSMPCWLHAWLMNDATAGRCIAVGKCCRSNLHQAVAAGCNLLAASVSSSSSRRRRAAE